MIQLADILTCVSSPDITTFGKTPHAFASYQEAASGTADRRVTAEGQYLRGAFIGRSQASLYISSATYQCTPQYNVHNLSSTVQPVYWTDIESDFDFRIYSPQAFKKAWRASQILLINEKIDHFLRRHQDWDGDEGIAPTQQAALDAKAFMNSIPSDLDLPTVVLAPGDGEILFQWHKKGGFIEVGFYGDQTISWYAKTDNDFSKFGDDLFNFEKSEEVSMHLIEAIRYLTN